MADDTTKKSGKSNYSTQNAPATGPLYPAASGTAASGSAVKTPDHHISYDPMELNKRPQWNNFAIAQDKHKTADGVVADSAYYKRYFSVIDAEIYFGNQYVEDIAQIDWQIQQHLFPLFGYNSYTYDEMARGNRIISGSFMINFTTPRYLLKILKEAAKDVNNSITDMKTYYVPRLGENAVAINQKYNGTVKGNKHKPIWPETFDIDVVFGQKTAIANPVHIVLEGVALGSCQLALSGAGGSMPNVMEQYSFMARDIKVAAS